MNAFEGFMEFRKEKDYLGERDVPADAYWGIHTLRARENFFLSGRPVNPRLIKAYALVKKACCLANRETGYLAQEKADAIAAACDEVSQGRWADQFPVDALQGGAGTSTNMNVNEVIANRAIEILGGVKGDYRLIHPIEDVNLHQSTNDTYPTAIKVAAIAAVRDAARAIEILQGIFQHKEKEFAGVVTTGRTEMQDAVPMTLGAAFSAFADALSRDRWRTFKCEERLRVVNLGGTAVGTGLGAPRRYIFLVIEKLREVTGMGLSRGENLVDQTANADSFVEVSGILKAHAATMMKIANDLRLLNMLGEIALPPVQAGSSLMPGKINPVIAEACLHGAMQVMANDTLVASCAGNGTLQINEFLPLLADALLGSCELTVNMSVLMAPCVAGITANTETARRYMDESPAIITAFLPYIGYERAGELLKLFTAAPRQSLREFLEHKLGREMVDRTLSPARLTALGYDDNTSKK